MSQEHNPFNILGKESAPINHGETVSETGSGDLNQRIRQLIESSPVFLFMKGTPDNPQCGFSANVVSILNHLKIPYKTFDILGDPEIREGVKSYSSWPTYPQLYSRSELIGGNDIIVELFQSGELQEALT